MAGDNFIVSTPLEVIEHGVTPSAPPANYLLVYPKTDNKLYKQTSAGVETEIGGGGSFDDAFVWAFAVS